MGLKNERGRRGKECGVESKKEQKDVAEMEDGGVVKGRGNKVKKRCKRRKDKRKWRERESEEG